MPQLAEERPAWNERTIAIPKPYPGTTSTLDELVHLHGDHVLLRDVPLKDKTASGFYIPEGAERGDFETYQAEVVAVGPGRVWPDGVFRKVPLSPGDRVVVYFIAMVAGVTFWPDERHRIVDAQYILAVLEDGCP